MKYLYLTFILLILLLARVESQTKGIKAIEDLKKLAIQKDGVINFDMDLIRKYVYATNRPYSMIIYLTSSNPKFGCDVCIKIKNEIQYFGSYSFMEYLKSPDFDLNPVFLVIAESDQTMELFQKLGIQTIPHVIFHPKGSAEISSKTVYGRVEQFSQRGFRDFIRDNSGANFEIILGFFERYGHLFGIIACFLFALRILLTLYRKRQNPRLWMFLSLGLVATVLSGVFYIYIHHPPMYDYNPQTKQLSYFSRNTRSQTVVEGAMMGVLTMILAGLFILIADILPNKLSDKLSKFQLQSLFMIGFISLMACLYLLSMAFQMKYYRPFFFIPEEFKHPSLVFRG